MDKINYDRLMMEEVASFNGEKKTILLHSCCGPCSSAVIERLSEFFDITVIYYNPNIEPREEYEKRKNVQIGLLNELNIKYIDVPYDNEKFRTYTKGMENEPEGGARCHVCYGLRLRYTANLAKENNFDYFCTTLTVSPYKNSEVINKIGEAISKEYGIKYLYSDFKKREGYKRSIELCKKYCLYRQNYCGCLFSKNIGDKNEE
ncbi:MAG: epoxyqueuosine reductase QueH [Bacilli bacterium]|nr:epoxyqueuosine reductase QueH [Bacilli bacterium]